MIFTLTLNNGKVVDVDIEMDGFKPLGVQVYYNDTDIEIDFDDLDKVDQDLIFSTAQDKVIDAAEMQGDSFYNR